MHSDPMFIFSIHRTYYPTFRTRAASARIHPASLDARRTSTLTSASCPFETVKMNGAPISFHWPKLRLWLITVSRIIVEAI